MSIYYPQSLDDPPLPEQLQEWTKARLQGRARFVAIRVLLVTTIFTIGSFLAQVLLYLLFGTGMFLRGLEITDFNLAIIGLVVGWWKARIDWNQNEKIYLATSKNENTGEQT